MVRRGLILAMILTVSAAVPLPLPACATLAGLQVQCQCPMMRHCEDAKVTKFQETISCWCVGTGAPVPKAEIGESNLSFSLLTVGFPIHSASESMTSSAYSLSTLVASASSPPRLQAYLCVFLI